MHRTLFIGFSQIHRPRTEVQHALEIRLREESLVTFDTTFDQKLI
jgi:hypothetical protein